MSVSSIGAIPNSANEKSDKEIDTGYSGANNSNKCECKSNMLDHRNNDMPPQYQHIRHGPCSFKPEHYVTIHKLKSVSFIRKSSAGSNMYSS